VRSIMVEQMNKDERYSAFTRTESSGTRPWP